jgi:ankyrin repeat protein
MFLIDAGQARDPQTFRYMLARLLQETSLTTIEARGANGTSALHMATSKGMFNATKQILYAVYNKNRADLAAFGLVTSMLNTPNGRGAGCVSGLRLLIGLYCFSFGCVVSFFDGVDAAV